MKTIQLTKNRVCTVDNQDYDKVCKYKWWTNVSHGKFMAAASIKGRKILMHRLLMNVDKNNVVVVHKDGNSLNNRRSNLLVQSKCLSQTNSKLYNNNPSGFRGVSEYCNKWTAKITINRKCVHLGTFKTPKEASEAYQKAKSERNKVV